MSKIKILYIIDEITDVNAGTERQLSLLLRNLDRDIFEPHLMTLRATEWLDNDYYPCPVHNLEMGPVLSLSGFNKLTELRYFIADNNFHIVQTYFPDSSVVGVLAARQAGCKIIISTRRNTGYFYNSRLLMATKFANRHVSRFLANSERVVKEISEKEGIEPGRFSIIHNGLEVERFRFTEQDVKSARVFMGTAEYENLVGVVANLRPVKAIETFLRAAAEVSHMRKNVKFVIIGGGDENYTSEMKKMAQELSLSENIKFLGSVDNPTSFIKNFDVGVLTSRSEGLSNTLMEYAALGIASVATDIGGNSEIIQHGETGLIVPQDDPESTAEAINQLLDDNDKRERMGSRAAKKVWSKFNLKIMVKLHQALYTKMYDRVAVEREIARAE